LLNRDLFPLFAFPLHINRDFVVCVYYLRFFSIASSIDQSVRTLCFFLTFFSFSSNWFPGVCVCFVFSGHLLLLPYCSRDLKFKFDNNAYFFVFIITFVTDKKLRCVSVTVFVSVIELLFYLPKLCETQILTAKHTRKRTLAFEFWWAAANSCCHFLKKLHILARL